MNWRKQHKAKEKVFRKKGWGWWVGERDTSLMSYRAD